jgi:uncharacterized protein YuzB (UPF0349 family)
MGRMPDVVECCVGNTDAASLERIRDLDCRTDVKPCLQRCGACYEESLLVVDGTVKRGDSFEELLRELRCE